MQDRPNYYLLLDLDPSVNDWPAIETRLQEKRRQWSLEKTQGNPAFQRKAAHNLSISREIEETLKNPETREQEAKEARKLQEQARQSKLKELDEGIQLLRADNQCTREQLALLVKQFGGAISEKDIEARIRKAGIRIAESKSGGSGPLPFKERIEQTLSNSIKSNLDVLKLDNLYKFLGLNPRSSPRVLCETANAINKEILKIGLTDPESSARKELAGLCLALFRDEKEKEKYDNTIALEAMDQLKNSIELVGKDGFISLSEMDGLVKLARSRGVQPADARAHIEEYARKRKWGVASEERLPSEDLRQCGNCDTLAGSLTSTHCTKCGEALSIACPQCGAPTPTQDKACSKCGCHTGDAPAVNALRKAGQRLRVNGDFVAALDRIDRALLIWPMSKDLLSEKRKVETDQRERETELARIEEMAGLKKLIEARSALDKFARSHGSAGIENLKKRIDQNIAKSEAAFSEGEARRKAGKEEEAIDKYEEALSFCADLEQARQAMSACPPPAPAGLRVQIAGSVVRLTWREVTARGSISYRVLRKARAFPNNELDGEIVGEVRTSRIDDAGAESGTPWHYAAFALRGGVPSRASANSGPHLVTADANILSCRAGDGEVVLGWAPPKGCKRVEVWRKSGASFPRSGDGDRVAAAADGAHDSGLVNGTAYNYLISAVFEDPNHSGKEVYSVGVRRTAVPVPPPDPVTDLVCSRNGKTVILNWTPLRRSQVQIRQAAQPPSVQPGLVIPLEEAGRFGELAAASSTGNAQIPLSTQGRIFFIPLTVSAGTAVVGAPAVLVTIEDVTNLKAQSAGKNIVLTWDWPPGIDEVLVCFTHDGYPSDPIKTHSTRARVTRPEYDRNKCFELRDVVKQPHYFTVFARAPNSDVYSAGARVVASMGLSVSVSYRVVLKKALVSRSVQDAWLELQCSERASLPGLLIVCKQKNVPLSPADGTLISEVPDVCFQDGRARIPIPPQYRSKTTYVKLFFKEPKNAQEIRLMPAAKEELALG